MGLEIFEKLVDNSLALGLLAIGLYFMWKENKAYRTRQEAELLQLKTEVHNYYNTDRTFMLDIIQANTEAMSQLKECANDTNDIMRCFVPELNKFKKSEAWKRYQEEDKTKKQ